MASEERGKGEGGRGEEMKCLGLGEASRVGYYFMCKKMTCEEVKMSKCKS